MDIAIIPSGKTPSPQDFGQIFKLIGGYRISQALYVAVELGIPDLLFAGPKHCDDLAAKTKTHARRFIVFFAFWREPACSTRLVRERSSSRSLAPRFAPTYRARSARQYGCG